MVRLGVVAILFGLLTVCVGITSVLAQAAPTCHGQDATRPPGTGWQGWTLNCNGTCPVGYVCTTQDFDDDGDTITQCVCVKGTDVFAAIGADCTLLMTTLELGGREFDCYTLQCATPCDKTEGGLQVDCDC